MMPLMRTEQSSHSSPPMHRKNRGRRILLFLSLVALAWNEVEADTLSPEQRKSKQVVESPLWSHAPVPHIFPLPPPLPLSQSAIEPFTATSA